MAAKAERAAGRRFDRDHGVTTHALAFLSDLDPESTGDARAHATHYEPVPIATFRRLVAQLPAAVIRTSVFVDVGAGMGRAILLASEYAFKQVVGIEISPALLQTARDNLARAHDLATCCRDVRLVRGDARRHRFSAGDLVVFLYNPFDGEALDDVLDRLATRPTPGCEWILYYTPVHAARVQARN
ncbi:MAG: class I SAM-dependent methyltransferase, partial [Candidatus Eremiobacteraeota bacterium]|nr:class I SAM-dependent methyltransferase [Candidatus Eremiobacteraeota bacterium]